MLKKVFFSQINYFDLSDNICVVFALKTMSFYIQKFFFFFISISLLTLFYFWFFPFISISFNFKHSMEISPCNFSKQTVALLSFNDLIKGKINVSLLNQNSLAIVFPNEIDLDINLDTFCPLFETLMSNDDVLTITGLTNKYTKPMCYITQENWTLYLSQNSTNGKYIKTNYAGTCHYCDLLPDVFVVKLKPLMTNYDLKFLRSTNSGHLPFFMAIQNHSVYCPDVDLSSTVAQIDLTCNNLSSRWGPDFVLFPKDFDIFRIVIDDEREVWLNCVWSKSAYDLKLPIHCSNFLRQYLFDFVEILDKVYKLDYRIVFGTLLGAVRDQDIIPWTPDVDIFVSFDKSLSEADIDKIFVRTLHSKTSRRYSNFHRLSHPSNLPVVAIFPACPLLLTHLNASSVAIHNRTRNDMISRIISDYDFDVLNHRSSGYIDIYHRTFPWFKSNMYYLNAIYENPNYVKIHNRIFKGAKDPAALSQTLYGAKAITRIPNIAHEQWESYIEALMKK